MAYYTPFAVSVQFREVKRNGEDINVCKRAGKASAPVLEVCPVWVMLVNHSDRGIA